MAASIALPIESPRTLTERRNEVSAMPFSASSSELAPREVANEGRTIVELCAEDGSIKRCVRFIVSRNALGWIEPTLTRCGELLLLPFDWDRSGAPAIEDAAVRMMVDSLSSFMGERSSAPQCTPTRRGGVQVDWHEHGVDLEIEFAPGAPNGYAVFSDIDNSDLDWDGPVEEHLEDLQRLFRDRLIA